MSIKDKVIIGLIIVLLIIIGITIKTDASLNFDGHNINNDYELAEFAERNADIFVNTPMDYHWFTSPLSLYVGATDRDATIAQWHTATCANGSQSKLGYNQGEYAIERIIDINLDLNEEYKLLVYSVGNEGQEWVSNYPNLNGLASLAKSTYIASNGYSRWEGDDRFHYAPNSINVTYEDNGFRRQFQTFFGDESKVQKGDVPDEWLNNLPSGQGGWHSYLGESTVNENGFSYLNTVYNDNPTIYQTYETEYNSYQKVEKGTTERQLSTQKMNIDGMNYLALGPFRLNFNGGNFKTEIDGYNDEINYVFYGYENVKSDWANNMDQIQSGQDFFVIIKDTGLENINVKFIQMLNTYKARIILLHDQRSE
ncbi:MAG: hypothetical protein HFJ17_03445 [Clostridia bacterium]|nr:hypothetical protein [Clostridia bacterium]